MKTFNTKKIIKENKLFSSGGSKPQKRKEQSILRESKFGIPKFVTGEANLTAKNEAFSVSITKAMTKTKGVVFSDMTHKVEMIPLVNKKIKSEMATLS